MKWQYLDKMNFQQFEDFICLHGQVLEIQGNHWR